MEDSDQTPLLHEPLNAAVSDDHQATGLPSPVADDTGDDIIMGILTGVRITICLAFLFTLWSVVFLTMVVRVNETGIMQIGHDCSLLLQPNRFFVNTIIVEQPLVSNIKGPKLYGFNDQQPLDVVSSWSETHDASLGAYTHKEWVYFLTERSAINISYSVASSSNLLLTIAEGSDGYGEWLYDDSSPYTKLSWNIIQGNGLIQQNILQSGRYHIAIENLNSETQEVQLNIRARTFSYDTSNAYYVCMLAQGRCAFPLLFLKETRAVLTTPRLKQGTFFGGWYVKLAYGPRWSTYFGSIVVINGAMLVGIWLWNKYQYTVRLSESSWASLLQYIIEGNDDDDVSSFRIE